MPMKNLGLIFPAGGRKSPEEEISRYLPKDIGLLSNQIQFDEISPRGLIDMGNRVENAAKELTDQGADIIVFCCTSGSFIRGVGYDQELIARIEQATGRKALTTTTAVIAALKALRASRISMGTPYPDDVNTIEVEFLKESGIDVVSFKGLGITNPPFVSRTTSDQLYALAEAVDHPSAQAIFISCTGLIVVDLISNLEARFKKPVITSNQATLWMAMQLLERDEPLPLGKLFSPKMDCH